MKRTLLALGAVLTSTACASTSSDTLSSGFNAPNIGEDYVSVFNNERGGGYSEPDGDGFAYRLGGVPVEGGLRAEAGLIPSTDVSARPVTGSGQYVAIYEFVEISNVAVVDGQTRGTLGGGTGTITLQADFDRGTLRGSNGPLAVNGRLNGVDLTGQVTVNGVSGALDGLAGGDQTFGVFHGTDEDSAFAGGFAGNLR